MDKIKMTTPLVEMDGDEMTRILWKEIKEELLLPFVELKTEYYDLGLPERDKTGDQVTIDAANATKQYGVAVKCATITPNAQRMEEYRLTEMWKSPNGTIRSILDGTVFRTPIMVEGISPVVKNWQEPITIARHAFGDVYKATDYRVPCPGKAELLFHGEDGTEFRKTIYDFECPGVLQGQFNKDSSIYSFARSCFQFAIDTKQDLWFSTKDTISKQYDHRFKDIFAEIFAAEYEAKFKELGITYFYTLIDDAVARVIRSKGGFIWACKNYDYEAAHGTVTRHYYKYLKGEETSTNPVATIFAWSGALRKRGELDGIAELSQFADALEGATLDTIRSGVMTGDLALLWEGEEPAQKVSSIAFLKEIRNHLEAKLS